MMRSGPQGTLTIRHLCAAAGVSPASYYRHWQGSAPREADTETRALIQTIALGDKSYRGYRYVQGELARRGHVMGTKRIRRLMQEDNLFALRRRPFVPVTTDSRHGWRIVPNLARGLVPTDLDQLWVADITYIHLQEEFAYLAVVLDAFSRRAIGWAVADHLQASLAIEALETAIAARRPAPGSLIHHSDRGVQYACADYTRVLALHDIRASMSRVGNPYDNAKAERFMRTLKEEEVDARDYRDCEEARRHIGAFIDKTYNERRLHSALGYRPPAEFEMLHRAQRNTTTSMNSPAQPDAPHASP
jgi:putative transposase